MASSPRKTETIVGAVALVLGAVFLIWAFTGGGLFSSGGYRLSARFDQVDGLAVGSEVRLAGVVVGEVGKLAYDPESHQAVVTIVMRKEVALPQDTSASVVQNGVLGDKFVDLSPGGSPDIISPGGEIRYTQSSVLIIDILQRIVGNAERRRQSANGG